MLNSKIILGLVLAVAVLAGVVTLMQTNKEKDLPSTSKTTEENKQNNNNPDQVVCTQDAKRCPDGSYVGRTGPNCEFAECPSGLQSNMDNKKIMNEDKEISPPPTQTINGQYLTNLDITDNTQNLLENLKITRAEKFVLFFHAPWCPFCKGADKAFLARQNEIPQNTAVIKVDYDSHPELKKKYGVTYQHTFVQVDRDGNQITKWNGGDIENLKKYLK